MQQFAASGYSLSRRVWQTQRDPFERTRLARAPGHLCAMLLRPPYLSQKLDRPLPTKDGGTLRTIGEACDYMTSMGRQQRRVA
jgi:hypothetical protein